MITSIIFSKDRAAQLGLMLESARKNLPEFFDLCVVYTGSSDEYEAGYEKLITELPDSRQVSFIKQNIFKEDVEALLSDGRQVACMFTDDDIVYEKCRFTYNEASRILDELHMCCISLRLGENTTIQDPYAGTNTYMPSVTQRLDDFFDLERAFVWDARAIPNHLNFGYPMSVDGHIFNTKTLLDIMQDMEYDNPNQLEAQISNKTEEVPPLMACFNKSKVVNTPLNLVGSSENNAGKWYGESLQEMNEKFLNNYKIDMSSMDFSNIIGCHQEIELKWKLGTE